MHNTFDVTETEGKFKATSHNFPNISAEGKTEAEAIDSMSRAIVYYADNNPKEYKKNIQDRIKSGLSCLCGEKLNGQVIAVKGKV